MRATMLLLATSNGVGVNVRLVGYGLSVSRYQGIYIRPPTDKRRVCILCVKHHIYVVFEWYFVHILSIML